MYRTSVYIDDTGTPGQKSKSIYDSGDWKSWIAVVYSSIENKHCTEALDKMLSYYKLHFGINEFHFTDIYSGRKEFKDVAPEIRINIFQEFSEFYAILKAPIWVQSFTSDDILRNKLFIDEGIKSNSFDLSNHSDLALNFLLFNLRKYLKKEKNKYPTPVDIFIDAGRQKPNSVQPIHFLEDISESGNVNYKSSEEMSMIQLADFIAYSINKSRWILMNDKKTKVDKLFLEIVGQANFNVINLEKKEIDIENFSSADYDTELRKKYNKNNNLTDKQLEEIKKKF